MTGDETGAGLARGFTGELSRQRFNNPSHALFAKNILLQLQRLSRHGESVRMEVLDATSLAERLKWEAKEYWLHLEAESPLDKYPGKH